MNFADPKDRIAMAKYALECTSDETDSENENDISNNNLFHSNQSDCGDYVSSDEISSSSNELDNMEEESDQDLVPKYLTSPTIIVNRGENRWKSFKHK
ncbi:unnamed protein product [Rotaria sordida]|uniref:Uncharacterized protein n=1 Tax=Rotaria sordida TaxID=392033 RepID=A0A814VQL9_9BILA|nr:unnamed protein product [Rotaria sordida]